MLGFFWNPFLTHGGIVPCAFGQIVAFGVARQAARPYASPRSPNMIREAIIETPQPQRPRGLLWAVGPLLILGGTALYLFLHWSQIPETIPGHWGPSGHPDRWIARTPVHVFRRLYPEAYGCLLILLLCVGILWRARGAMRLKQLSAMALTGIGYWLAVLGSWIALHPLPLGEDLTPWVFPSLLLPAVWLIVLYLYGVEKGLLPNARSRWPGMTTLRPSVTDQMPDDHWKAGVFYYNPDDPALFVEARSGLGFALNIARPMGWGLVVAALAPLAGIPILFKR
jgi:hypothetical protein